MSRSPSPSRIHDDFDLEHMSSEELRALGTRVSEELEARSFEENLRREVQTHLRRRDDGTPARGHTGRRNKSRGGYG